MEEHKVKLDKEYEQLMQNFTKDLERLKVKHQQEQEKKVSRISHIYTPEKGINNQTYNVPQK